MKGGSVVRKRLISVIAVFLAMQGDVVGAEQPLLRLGVISDIHLRTNNPQSTIPLERALAYFRDRHVDGIVVAGDIADLGTREQMNLFVQTWRQMFPGDRLPSGECVARLIVTGNHEAECDPGLLGENGETDPAWRQRTFSYGENRQLFWKELFGEPYKPFSIKTIKGFRIVLAQDGERGLSEFLSTHRGELAGDCPFFYVGHRPPPGTVGSPWLTGAMVADKSVTRALAEYPNAIALTGHSHTTLTDERMCWQGDFISIGTGTLFWTIPWGGRENAETFGAVNRCVRQMPDVSGDAWQGLIVSVYADQLIAERREFRFGDSLGPDWVLPLPHRPTNGHFPCVPEDRPSFSAGDRVDMRLCHRDDAAGKPADVVVVSFPPALSGPGRSRAFDYEVTVEGKDMDAGRRLTKRVYSPSWNLGETQERGFVECWFSINELGGGVWRCEVSPLDCMGRSGRPLVSDFRLK